jgi:hypothetical protein
VSSKLNALIVIATECFNCFIGTLKNERQARSRVYSLSISGPILGVLFTLYHGEYVLYGFMRFLIQKYDPSHVCEAKNPVSITENQLRRRSNGILS